MKQKFAEVLNFIRFLPTFTFPQIQPDRSIFYDGIRGFACIIVVLAHCFWQFYYGSNRSLLIIDSNGKSGVWLFFMLSSFLLTSQIFAWNAADYCSGSKSLKKFQLLSLRQIQILKTDSNFEDRFKSVTSIRKRLQKFSTFRFSKILIIK